MHSRPEQRARGGGRDAVRARAGLGDDPRLAHALGQQRLAERVVDLVRAGVVEVLALEVDGVADLVGQPLREVQRRRAADVVVEQRVELGAVARVVAGGEPRRLELDQRGHERLRDVLAAVGAEAVLDGAHVTLPGDGGDRLRVSRLRVDARAKNASSLSGSLIAGRASTPLAHVDPPRARGGDRRRRRSRGSARRRAGTGSCCGAARAGSSPTCARCRRRRPASAVSSRW